MDNQNNNDVRDDGGGGSGGGGDVDGDGDGGGNRHYLFLNDKMVYEPLLSTWSSLFYSRRNPTQHGFKALVFGSEALVFCGSRKVSRGFRTTCDRGPQ